MAKCKTLGCKHEATDQPLDIVHTRSGGKKIKLTVGLCTEHRMQASDDIKVGKALSIEIQYPAYCPIDAQLLERVGLAKDGISRRGKCPVCKQDWVENRLNNWVPA
jgi:hypothetical protein